MLEIFSTGGLLTNRILSSRSDIQEISMNNKELRISNYCACFIDLLGQRIALKDQNLIPQFKDIASKNLFMNEVSKSIGAIARLQENAEFFRAETNSPTDLRDHLSEDDKDLYDEMKTPKAKQQRWSDGLVFYHPLDTELTKCPMNAVYDIFVLSGILCLLGLADKEPIRGAIETSWGVELHDNELYGAVVANSYILESTVAQYPRIVIGQYTVEYLKQQLKSSADGLDKFQLYNHNLAVKCINMMTTDKDGHYIIDYLGQEFKDSALHDAGAHFYEKAFEYICEQYELHKTNKNSKLALRYSWLKDYFTQNRDTHI